MALLPGVPEAGRTEAARAALGAFGRRLGSAIYLIDALDDLEQDHRGDGFNPCLVVEGKRRAGREAPRRVSWPRVEMAWGMLRDDLVALGELVGVLPLLRHRDMVSSVVAVELPRMARAAAKRAHAYARDEDARLRAARRAPALPARVGRVAAMVATVFVLFWVWLSSIPALARGKRPPGPRSPSTPSASVHGVEGGVDGGTATPPERWDPKLPAPPAGVRQPRRPPRPRTRTARAGRGPHRHRPRARPRRRMERIERRTVPALLRPLREHVQGLLRLLRRVQGGRLRRVHQVVRRVRLVRVVLQGRQVGRK